MLIKEIIVVEGKDDTVAVKNAVNADTIETNGSAINQETLEKIKLAHETRGVIILTDPDFPGEKIRKTISDYVPGCKHAFIPKQLALPSKGKGLGVEHASRETIRAALRDVQQEMNEPIEEITVEDLVDAGLLGGPSAKSRRKKLGDHLKIGYANGKQLHKRLKMFQIKKEAFRQAYIEILQEEKE